jgi:hypothetical protein
VSELTSTGAGAAAHKRAQYPAKFWRINFEKEREIEF